MWISTGSPGPLQVGSCNFPAMPSRSLQPGISTALSGSSGVLYAPGQNGVLPVPQVLVQKSVGFSPPGIANANVASECMSTSTDDEEFADCMIPEMMSPSQRDAYACTKRYKRDAFMRSSCLAKMVVGKNEQKYISQATNCYQKIRS